MPNNAKKNNILLVGFMGAGKTTIGKLLAKSMVFNFIESFENSVESFYAFTCHQDLV